MQSYNGNIKLTKFRLSAMHCTAVCDYGRKALQRDNWKLAFKIEGFIVEITSC